MDYIDLGGSLRVITAVMSHNIPMIFILDIFVQAPPGVKDFRSRNIMVV